MKGLLIGIVSIVTLLSVNNFNNVYEEYGSSTGHFYYESTQNVKKSVVWTIRDVQKDAPMDYIRNDIMWLDQSLYRMIVDFDDYIWK